MTSKKGYTKNNANGKNEPFNRFIHGNIPWKKSKEEVWENILSTINKPLEKKTKTPVLIFVRYAAAASIIMLLGLSSFLGFYSKTFTTKPGQELDITFPDGSKTKLHAESTIKYNPYWWKFSRKAELKGEAFFVVTKGNKFEIKSKQGKTIVLGTSFNILSDDDTYEVTCINGMLKVIAALTKDEVILKQNQKALLDKSGMLEIKTNTNIKKATDWTRQEFSFTSSPLEDVFRKIEASYGITIKYTIKEKLIYTGYFKKDNNVENILNLVCMAFDIKFEEISDGVYQISND